MDRIVVDELTLEECSKYDIVNIMENDIFNERIYVIVNDQEYVDLEELCFYLYENKEKPQVYRLNNSMTFYKLATATADFIAEYEEKLNGDING